MRAGAFLAFSFLLIAAGCEDQSAQRVPATPQTANATPAPSDAPAAAPQPPSDSAPATSSGDAAQYQPSNPPPSYANPYAAAPANSASAVPQAAPQADPTAGANANAQGLAPPGQPPVFEKAEAGVGVKGDNLGAGIYSTPARAYFQTRERLAFIQVEQAIQLYRGVEGRLPQTHEEFMEKVIQANNIQLPQLSGGSRYVWDAEKGELMVERPRP